MGEKVNKIKETWWKRDIQCEGPCLWKCNEGIGHWYDQEPRQRRRKMRRIFVGGHAGGPWVKKTSAQLMCHDNFCLLKWISAQPNFWLSLYAETKLIKTISTVIGTAESSWLSVVIYMKNKKDFLHWTKLLTSEESSAMNCNYYWCQRTKIQMII